MWWKRTAIKIKIPQKKYKTEAEQTSPLDLTTSHLYQTYFVSILGEEKFKRMTIQLCNKDLKTYPMEQQYPTIDHINMIINIKTNFKLNSIFLSSFYIRFCFGSMVSDGMVVSNIVNILYISQFFSAFL